MEYPKINSLFKREGAYYDESVRQGAPLPKPEDRSKFIIGDYASPEFPNIRRWTVQEKIDGTNIRVMLSKTSSGWDIDFRGRTDKAQMPPKLLSYLKNHFLAKLISSTFDENLAPDCDTVEIILYGEGCGKKIQSGSYYSEEQRFVLFDVKIGRWWLTPEAVIKMAEQLGVPSVPIIGVMEEQQIIEYVKSKPNSVFAKDEHVTEGVVARAEPMMLYRTGVPIKFKLKCKDFK